MVLTSKNAWSFLEVNIYRGLPNAITGMQKINARRNTNCNLGCASNMYSLQPGATLTGSKNTMLMRVRRIDGAHPELH